MTKDFKIRHISIDDSIATLEIYRPFVQNTATSFEYDVPDLEEWENRIRTIADEYPWLICEYKGEIAGYAYGSKHRTRTAYSWSAESTIYLSEKNHGLRIGKVLYQTLFELLRLQGYVNAFAGVTVPNEKSEKFHKKMGFDEIGTFKKIGFKFGEWHDTRWFQLHLVEHPIEPGKLKKPHEVQEKAALIIEKANEQLNLLAADKEFIPSKPHGTD